MIYQGRAGRRVAQVAKSQLALRLGLAAYAALCTAVALRCAVLLLGFAESVWSVQAILSMSAPIVLPLTLLPVARHPVIASATLADITTAVLLLSLPLALVGRRTRG